MGVTRAELSSARVSSSIKASSSSLSTLFVDLIVMVRNVHVSELALRLWHWRNLLPLFCSD